MVKEKRKKPLDEEHPTSVNPASTQRSTKKRGRIIIRNLPFKNLSENAVREVFAQYGTIIDVQLLKKPNGKYVGCGFIEYDNRQSAAKAIVKGNGYLMNGRPIVVDWALPKNTYISKVKQEIEEVKVKDEPVSDEEENEADGSVNADREIKSEDDSEEDDVGNSDEDSDETEDVVMEEDEEEVKEERKNVPSDVEEGKTVFLKNVPFSASNEDVKNALKVYGPMVYALICIDELTEHSKGTAFAKFKEKESADECIKNSNKIIIKDQAVQVTRALSKTQLEEAKKQKKKVKDSRNLYLVREGVITAGSPAAATVSASDMAKRLQIEQWKSQILRNLNMFVSKTRLVVHNLPPNYDDTKLRALFKEHSRPNAIIKEARVMQDRKRYDGKGNAISKEVGFVTFTNHDDALYALRRINNNPDVFTINKRPIVAFSIENREILHLKQKRLERSKIKVLGDKVKDKLYQKLNKKQRRFLKRKEKFIKARQEAKKSGQNPKEVSKKRKKEKLPSKTSDEKETEDFSGMTSVPGKKLKMRSRLKLKKQAEVHKNRLKEIKKDKKLKRGAIERKKLQKEKQPKVKKREKVVDDHFTRLVESYKSKLVNSDSLKKWNET